MAAKRFNDLALVVFDMAGTTIEDAGQVPEAFTTVLRTHGIEIGESELNALRGASKRDAIRHFVAHQPIEQQGAGSIDERTETIFADFRNYLSRLFRGGGVKPIEGASQTFSWLRAHGIKVALNTGFDRTIADLIVDAVEWRASVDAVVCGDDVSKGRPAPDLLFEAMKRTGVNDASKVMAVGDTVLDLKAAANAGAGWAVGVLSGAHRRAQLESEPGGLVLSSVADLPALIEAGRSPL